MEIRDQNMNIVQVIGITSNRLEKIHLRDIDGFLCGLGGSIGDLTKVSQFNFSKGFCLRCKFIYNSRYNTLLKSQIDSYEFLIIKLKLGVKV